MDYKVEELKFYNMKRTGKYISNSVHTNNSISIFSLENELSIDEKVVFIDAVKNGIASYLLNIINKWMEEKNTLPKDSWGTPKTVSTKAWIKRNDPQKKIDIDYKIGSYYLFGTKFLCLDTVCPYTEYNFSLTYTGENIVHQWFHDLCKELYQDEKKYFKEHDQFYIKLAKVKELGKEYKILFGSKVLNDIVWNQEEDVTEEQLDSYILAYSKLEEAIDEITKELADISLIKEVK